MAKQNGKNKNELEKKAPAPITKAYDYGEMAGAGYENTTQQDQSIPFLGVLQQLSPQCSEGDGKFVEGAKPGKLINTVTNTLYDEVIFIPCTTQHVYTEWVPRDSGGGFVAQHGIDSDTVRAARAAAKQFGRYKTPSGNDLVETFYMFGMRLDNPDDEEMAEPLVIAFTSTKIRRYKAIMTLLRTVRMRPPLFANRLLIRTVKEKNNKGTFYNLDITPLNKDVVASLIPPETSADGGGPHPLLEAGRLLSEQVNSGLAHADHGSQERESGGGTEEGNPAF